MLRGFAIGVLLSPLALLLFGFLGNHLWIFTWAAWAAFAIFVLLIGFGIYDWITRAGTGEDE